MAVLSKGSLFDPVLIKDLITKVRGKSSLAKLSRMTPVSFVGNKEFIFNMDSEIDIVAENTQKKDGGATLTPVTIVPIKFVYGMRVSDEFMFAAGEKPISKNRSRSCRRSTMGFPKKSHPDLTRRRFTVSIRQPEPHPP